MTPTPNSMHLSNSLFLLMVTVFASLYVSAQAPKQPRIHVFAQGDQVEVHIDGKPFTGLIWQERIKKPVLFPVRTASGTTITRGWPLNPVAGERVDHPHHVGIWLNYGKVNGYDFWNNSPEKSAENPEHYGHIELVSIDEMKSGTEQGELAVTMHWLSPDGAVLIKEQTRFIFEGGETDRVITRITSLEAGDQQVVFEDNKEGMFGIRVRRALELPTKKPIKLSLADGSVDPEPRLDNTGVLGDYRSSEGITGKGVWGTRARWMSLDSELENKLVSVVIMDHSQNPGYPTYWHARDYGLFAANPLGQKIFSKGEEELQLKLAPGAKITFRHQVLVIEGAKPDVKELETRFTTFNP